MLYANIILTNRRSEHHTWPLTDLHIKSLAFAQAMQRHSHAHTQAMHKPTLAVGVGAAKALEVNADGHGLGPEGFLVTNTTDGGTSLPNGSVVMSGVSGFGGPRGT